MKILPRLTQWFRSTFKVGTKITPTYVAFSSWHKPSATEIQRTIDGPQRRGWIKAPIAKHADDTTPKEAAKLHDWFQSPEERIMPHQNRRPHE